MKKLFAFFMALFLCASLAACGNKDATPASTKKEPIKIVVTNFPEYDFVRQITGDKAKVTMLLKPGAEAHSYEPTPKDIQEISGSDLFVYVGGDSDEWVDGILDSMDKKPGKVFKLMDAVPLYEEEHVEGMAEHDHDHDHHHDEDAHHDDKDHDHEHEHAHKEDADHKEHAHDHDHEHAHKEDADHKEHAHGHEHEHGEEAEMDEHVWTSPKNAIEIVEKLNDTISEIDPENKDFYKKNTEAYVEKLKKLDSQFRDVIDNGKRKEIIVGDRFPFLYFVKEYGLKYYAAFPGCSTDTETNPATVAFLIDKVKEDGIPVVFHIEMSNEQMSRSIAEATGAKNELLNAVHNVSDEDFKKGVTYIDLMEHNVEALREALN